MLWLGFLCAAMLVFAGAWAVTHPEADLWYRGAGGFGSAFSARTRQFLGWFVIVGALAFLYLVVPRLA